MPRDVAGPGPKKLGRLDPFSWVAIVPLAGIAVLAMISGGLIVIGLVLLVLAGLLALFDMWSNRAMEGDERRRPPARRPAQDRRANQPQAGRPRPQPGRQQPAARQFGGRQGAARQPSGGGRQQPPPANGRQQPARQPARQQGARQPARQPGARPRPQPRRDPGDYDRRR